MKHPSDWGHSDIEDDWRDVFLRDVAGEQRTKRVADSFPAWRNPGPRKKRTAAERRKRKAKRKQAKQARRRNR